MTSETKQSPVKIKEQVTLESPQSRSRTQYSSFVISPVDLNFRINVQKNKTDKKFKDRLFEISKLTDPETMRSLTVASTHEKMIQEILRNSVSSAQNSI